MPTLHWDVFEKEVVDYNYSQARKNATLPLSYQQIRLLFVCHQTNVLAIILLLIIITLRS